MENQTTENTQPPKKSTRKKRSSDNPFTVSNIQLKRTDGEKSELVSDFFTELDKLGMELAEMPEKLSVGGTQIVMEAFLHFKADKSFLEILRKKYECKTTRAKMWLKGHNIERKKEGLPPIKMTEFQVDVQPNLKKGDYERFLKLSKDSSSGISEPPSELQ